MIPSSWLYSRRFNPMDLILGRRPRIIVACVLTLALYSTALMAWHYAVTWTGTHRHYSRPDLVWEFLSTMYGSGELWTFWLATLKRLWFFPIIIWVGFRCGMRLSLYPWAAAPSAVSLGGFNAMSKIGILPLFVIWFGLFEFSKIMFVAYTSFLTSLTLSYFSTRSVLREVVHGGPSKDRILYAITQGMTRSGLLKYVLAPRLLPYEFITNWILSFLLWTLAVIIEATGTVEGLGYLVARGGTTSNVTEIMTGVLLLMISHIMTGGLIFLAEHLVAGSRRGRMPLV